jgi:HflC protein
MKLSVFGGILAAIIIVALIVAYSTLFTVDQTQQALVVRLGDPIRVVTEPGLNYKIPLIDTVIPIDKRILDLENPAQEVIASDQKRLVVDAFARYRIQEPLRFYQTVNTVQGANSQLSVLLNAALRRVLGEATLTHVVRDDRAAESRHVDRVGVPSLGEPLKRVVRSGRVHLTRSAGPTPTWPACAAAPLGAGSQSPRSPPATPGRPRSRGRPPLRQPTQTRGG